MVLKNIIAYSGVNLISQVLLFGQNFIVRGLLAPAVLGIWNYVGVIQGFLGTFDLGITAAASRELPMIRGTGDVEAETGSRSSAFWSRVAQGILLSAGTLIYLALFRNSIQHPVAFLVAALLVVISAINEALNIFHQGAQKYISLSRVLLLTGIAQALAISLGTYLAGLTGLMICAVLVQMLLAVMLFKSCLESGLHILPRWQWQIFKRQVGFGLPFRLVDYPQSVFTMLDLLFITWFMNVGALAIYTTARFMFNSAVEMQARMSNVIITRLYEIGVTQNGRRQMATEIRDFLLLEYLLLLPTVICLALYLGSFLISQFIPKYAESVPLLGIILGATYFVPQTTLVRNFWILDKRLFSLGISNLVGLLGMAAMLYAMVTLRGQTLASVALSMVGGSMIYYAYIMFSVGREVWGWESVLGLSLAAIVAFAYTFLIVFHCLPSFSPNAFWANFAILLKSLSLCFIYLMPLFVLGGWLLLRYGNFKFWFLETSTAFLKLQKLARTGVFSRQ